MSPVTPIPPILLRALLLLTVIYVALLSVPVSLTPCGLGLDASWQLGLNLAHHQELVPGRDIVFTYGPFGYLFYPERASGTPLLALLFRLGLYLVSTLALLRLLWILPSKVSAFWTLALLGLAAALDALPAESQIVSPLERLALVVLVDRSRWRYAELSVLAFIAALGVLAKLNQGIEGVALFVVVLAIAVYQDWPLARPARRQILAAAAVLPLSVVILFLISTGHLLDLRLYLANGWQIVSGYSEAMGLPGPLWQAALACATIAMTFAAIYLVANDLRALWPAFAPTLIVTFFVFKHAMVRQGPGHAPAFHLNFAVGLLFLLVFANTARDRRLIVVLQLFSVAVGFAISVEAYPWFGPAVAQRLQLRAAGASLSDFWRWGATWEKIGEANDLRRKQLVLPDRFHQLIQNSTVDAVPWDIDVVQANHWKWDPRPIFQSYSAYTPALDQINAAYLESDRAAEFIILSVPGIDGRHPFLETPLTWHSLLDRYDLKLAAPDHFLLQHRQSHRYAAPVLIGKSTASWNQDLKVPSTGGLLLMSPHIEPSLMGKAASTLYRSAPVFMEAAFGSGKRVSWRTVPRNLASGFLIRPFPQDLQELRELFTPEPLQAPADQVVAVSFHTARPSEFASEIPIEWSRLPVQANPTREVPVFPLPQNVLVPLWRAGDPLPQPSNAQIQVRRNWIEVTPQTDDPQLLFQIGPGLERFRTLIVRAWFEKADRIDLFFGKQVDGRGVYGTVPLTRQWVDVYLNVSQNPFWDTEHGASLRFDPVSSAGPGTASRIAAIWASPVAASEVSPEVQFFPVPPAQAPKGP